VQGFFFSQPLPLADTLNYIARHYQPQQQGKSESGPSGLGGQA
jgi:hypothetical protein